EPARTYAPLKNTETAKTKRIATARFRSSGDQPLPKIIQENTAIEIASRTHPSPLEIASAVILMAPVEARAARTMRTSRQAVTTIEPFRFCARSRTGSPELEACSPAVPRCF